jgi:hypothetical protein
LGLKDKDSEDLDGLDEIAGVSEGLSIDERLGRPKPRLWDTRPCSKVTDKPIKKLSDARWWKKDGYRLAGDDLRDVLRRIKAGDKAAETLLIKCYHGALLKEASSVFYAGPEFEDKLQVAAEGLIKAARGYNLTANNGLWAYALRTIRNELADLVLGWRRKGGKLETREDRGPAKRPPGFARSMAATTSAENVTPTTGRVGGERKPPAGSLLTITRYENAMAVAARSPTRLGTELLPGVRWLQIIHGMSLDSNRASRSVGRNTRKTKPGHTGSILPRGPGSGSRRAWQR